MSETQLQLDDFTRYRAAGRPREGRERADPQQVTQERSMAWPESTGISKITHIYEGTNQIQRTVMARQLLK